MMWNWKSKTPSNPDKIVISDTACLIGLANIGQIKILQEMYGSIIVTPEVIKEYGTMLPEWIVVKEVPDLKRITVFNKLIGPGESSVISLALETENSLLIIDDRRARQFALDLGLDIIGTLGLLIRAYENGIIPDIDSIIIKLRDSGFRLPTNTDVLIKAIKK